jgi:hypothetical protein
MKTSELNKTLERHQLWIETKGVQGERADLRVANLTYANLEGANLRDAFLRDANLEDANLKDANLRRASLYAANLTGANLTGANLTRANLTRAKLWSASLYGANLEGANLSGADLRYVKLSHAILPNISWIIPGCLVQLNNIMDKFYLQKEGKWENFIQDTFGFFIQNNGEEGTFDMLVEDRIIRNIPHWVKYSGLKQIASESV